jgi:hypothetical protein
MPNILRLQWNLTVSVSKGLGFYFPIVQYASDPDLTEVTTITEAPYIYCELHIDTSEVEIPKGKSKWTI